MMMSMRTGLMSQFEPTRENGPSSSVGDLFDSFRSASDFLAALNWPDEYQLAQFSTKLAKVSARVFFTFLVWTCQFCRVIKSDRDVTDGEAVSRVLITQTFSLSINDYCQKMEQLFAADMRQNDVQQPAQAEAKQRAWLEKAKSTIATLQGEKKIQAFFNFTPAVSQVLISRRVVEIITVKMGRS
jgi:hypothetical protein